MSYVDQMLQQSFPLTAFYNGGSLLMRAITPFRSGDTVVFQGEVTGQTGSGREKVGGLPGQGRQPAGRVGLPGRCNNGVLAQQPVNPLRRDQG